MNFLARFRPAPEVEIASDAVENVRRRSFSAAQFRDEELARAAEERALEDAAEATAAEAAAQTRAQRLAHVVTGSPNIELRSGMVDADAMSALFAGADVVMSLHRSEGLGLVLAEAMLRGLPPQRTCAASRWSRCPRRCSPRWTAPSAARLASTTRWARISSAPFTRRPPY